MKDVDRSKTNKERGAKQVYNIKSFDLSLLLILFIQSNIVRVKSFEFCEMIPSFILMVPSSTYFLVSLQLSMEQGFEDQTNGQSQGEFTDNLIKYFKQARPLVFVKDH
jgi:hypothetical protein